MTFPATRSASDATTRARSPGSPTGHTYSSSVLRNGAGVTRGCTRLGRGGSMSRDVPANRQRQAHRMILRGLAIGLRVGAAASGDWMLDFAATPTGRPRPPVTRGPASSSTAGAPASCVAVRGGVADGLGAPRAAAGAQKPREWLAGAIIRGCDTAHVPLQRIAPLRAALTAPPPRAHPKPPIPQTTRAAAMPLRACLQEKSGDGLHDPARGMRGHTRPIVVREVTRSEECGGGGGADTVAKTVVVVTTVFPRHDHPAHWSHAPQNSRR